METLILICFAVYFVSICAFFFLGMAIMRTQKNREIKDCRRRVSQYEELRQTQADTIRRVGLKYTNLKHGIAKLMKRYKGLANESSFGKALREVIDG